MNKTIYLRTMVAALAGLAITAVALAADVPQERPAAKPQDRTIRWVEAEHYAAQRGSSAASYKIPGALGGACVDNGWGGQKGDFLRYKLESVR